MTDRQQFIEQCIIPTLDDPDDFDVDAICDEVSDFDERDGYVWRNEYDMDSNEYDESAYWKVVARHQL